MHDARPVLALHLSQVADAAMGDKGIYQGVAIMPPRRMAHEARLLGEHDEMLVLVANVQGNVIDSLDYATFAATGRNLDVDLIAGHHDALLGRGLAVNEYATGLDEAHGSRARSEFIDAEGSHEDVKARTLLVDAYLTIEDVRHHPSSSSASESTPVKMMATRKRMTPQVTQISATLKTGKSMKVKRMKSTT